MRRQNIFILIFIFIFLKNTFSSDHFFKILESEKTVKIVNGLFVFGLANAIKNFYQYRGSENYKILDFSLPKMQEEEYQNWFSIRIYNMLLFAEENPKNCIKNNLLMGLGVKDFLSIKDDEEFASSFYRKIERNFNEYELNSVKNVKKLLFNDNIIDRERRASESNMRGELDENLRYASYWNKQGLHHIKLEEANRPSQKNLVRCIISYHLEKMQQSIPFLFDKIHFLNDLIYSIITLGNIVQALAIVSLILMIVKNPTDENSLLKQSLKLWKNLPGEVKVLFSFKKIL